MQKLETLSRVRSKIIRISCKLFLASLVLTEACSSSSEPLQTGAEPLTASLLTWYPNAALSGEAPASVTTQVMALGGACSADGNMIPSAWETRVQGGNSAGYEIHWAVGCSNTTTVAQAAQQLTTSNTGIPPEWTGDPNWDGSPMLWVGQPHLAALGPPGWVALVGMVGDQLGVSQDTTLTAVNIAVALSTDSGRTWQPGLTHLVAPIAVNQGATNHTEGTLVTDLAVGVSSSTNSVGTHDLYVVWTANGGLRKTWEQTVRYGNSVPPTYSAGDTDPITQKSSPWSVGSIPSEYNVVAGHNSVIGDFLFLMAPVVGSLAAGQCPSGFAPANQSWRVYIAANLPVGEYWYLGNVATSAPSWPKCVGGSPHSTSASIYPNIARPALTYSTANNAVFSATTRLRPGDSSNSVAIHTKKFSWCVCNSTGCPPCNGAPGGTVGQDVADSARNDNVPTGTCDDQFDPVIAADPSTPDGLIAWYDTADLNSLVASMHGQVQNLLAAIPANNSKIFLPSPAYVWATDLSYSGGAPAGSDVFFLGFSDALQSGQAPTGQGGMYTIKTTP